jgi:hypothetical protein
MPSVVVRVAEAAGAVLYVYVVGGAVTAIRLQAAGLPSGPDVLSLLPGSQLLAVGGRALLFWLLLTVGLTAVGLVLVPHLDPFFDWLFRWRFMRSRVAFTAIATAVGMAATVAIVVFAPNPHGTYYLSRQGPRSS